MAIVFILFDFQMENAKRTLNHSNQLNLLMKPKANYFDQATIFQLMRKSIKLQIKPLIAAVVVKNERNYQILKKKFF